MLDNLLSDKSDKNISGLEIDLFYEYSTNFDIKMKIIYEGEIRYEENKKKCPDYQFVLTVYDKVNKVNFKPVRAYLDAKYRNYDVQGLEETFINKDIIEVAIEKYLKTFLGTNNEPIVSMIAHSCNDSKYVEYHLSLYYVCWNCGEAKNIEKIEKTTISGFVKYHYTCKECNEFWMKSHCSVPKLNHGIIKQIENYH